MNEIINHYQEYRKIGEAVNSSLFEQLADDAMEKCAALLGMLDETGSFIFDTEMDMDKLADLAIHDYVDNEGKTALNKLAESDKFTSLSEAEKDILQAKLNSIQSLFLVDYIKPSEGLIGLKDIFNGFKPIEIIDLSMSQTLSLKNKYLFTRVMSFETFSCTTGVASVFNKNKLHKVKKAYLKEMKKYPDLKVRIKKPVVFFHINKRYGNKAASQEV